jgi:hypothetical protein
MRNALALTKVGSTLPAANAMLLAVTVNSMTVVRKSKPEAQVAVDILVCAGIVIGGLLRIKKVKFPGIK